MINQLVSFGIAIIRMAANLATASLLLGAGINFLNIIARYFFHASIVWAEEVMLYLMLASVFFGAAAASLRGGHISMDIMLKILPAGWRKTIGMINDLLFIGVAFVLIYLAVPVISDFVAFDQRSDAARIPIAIPQMLIPVGFALMICATILHRMATPEQLKSVGLESAEAMLPKQD